VKYYAHTWFCSPQPTPRNLNGSKAAGAASNIGRIEISKWTIRDGVRQAIVTDRMLA